MNVIRLMLVTLSLFASSASIFGQNAHKNSIRVEVGMGYREVDYLNNANDFVSDDFDSNRFVPIGVVNYSHCISKSNEVLVGLAYLRTKGVHLVNGDVALEASPIPGRQLVSHIQKCDFFTIPVQFRHHFWKYMFVDAGLFLDMALPKGQTAQFMAGPGVGIGGEYVFPCGFVTSLYADARWTGIIKGYQLLQAGVALKVGYLFQL